LIKLQNYAKKAKLIAFFYILTLLLSYRKPCYQ